MRPGCSRAAPEAARLGPPEAAGAGDADGGTTAARPATRTTTMTAAAGRASTPGRLPSRAFTVFRAFNRDAMVPRSSSETRRALPPKTPEHEIRRGVHLRNSLTRICGRQPRVSHPTRRPYKTSARRSGLVTLGRRVQPGEGAEHSHVRSV